MKNYNLLAHKGYPMYQKLKMRSTGIDKDKNEVNGVSEINIVVTEPLEFGDTLSRYNELHTVVKVQETREPRGEHVDGALFQIVECLYVDKLPQ